MGKKTKKRPRWRKLSLEDADVARSPSPGHSEGGSSVTHREKPRPRSRNTFARSHSVTTYVFDEDEYTKIQTPRQDMIFKKSAFTKRRVPPEASLSEETETRSVSVSSDLTASPPACQRHPPVCGPAMAPAGVPAGVPAGGPAGGPACVPSCPPAAPPGGPPSEASASTPEMSEVSSDGKSTSDCGDGSEPAKDPLTALASQIQYAFIDPQGNVYFNVMDESGIIHLPPVAGYYMAPSFPGGPIIATPVPWQAVPIAPLDSPEYQALLNQQRKQQQQQQQAPAAAQQQQQLQHQQDLPGEDGSCSSRAGSRPRSVMSDANSAPATSGAGSRPRTPTPPGHLTSSGQELGDAEPENPISPVDEGKARRVKKKKKKQKKKTNSVDSGLTDEGSDGSREVAPPPPDSGALSSSDSNAPGGGRLRPSEPPKTERSPSEQTSGVQSDVSLPDSPQRRPSGEHGHVTVTSPRDVSVLHSAASVLSRQLDSQQLMMTPPITTATPPPSPIASSPSESKNDMAAVSGLEAAILSQLQQAAAAEASAAAVRAAPVFGEEVAACQDASQVVADTCDVSASPATGASALHGRDEDRDTEERQETADVDATDVADAVDAGDDDEESCNSFIYEDKSAGNLESTPPPAGETLLDDLPEDPSPPQLPCEAEIPSIRLCGEDREQSHASDLLLDFEEEVVSRPVFTDLSSPVDLRRTVILEETESERDRESSPGSALSEEISRPPTQERSPEPVLEPALESSLGRLLESEAVAVDTVPRQLASNDVVEPVHKGLGETVVVESETSSLCTGPQSLHTSIGAITQGPACKTPAASDHQMHITDVPAVEPEPVPVKDVPITPLAGATVLEAGAVAPAVSLPPPPAFQCQTSSEPSILGTPPPEDPSPPDRGPAEPSPPSSLSDKSISSAVRGWMKDQSPEALFLVPVDSDDDDILDDDNEDWESDVDDEEEPVQQPTTTTGSKNVQGNPSLAPRSSTARAGDRVASHLPGLSSVGVDGAVAASRGTSTYYSLGVALDQPEADAVMRVVDLDDRSVLTLPLDGAPASSSVADDDDSSQSESLAGPAQLAAAGRSGAVPPSSSLARELLEVGSIHRASDRKLIGDSAIFAAGAAQAAEEADEGYGGSPLASPEVRRLVDEGQVAAPRRQPPHPLRQVRAEVGGPWGICCSLQ